MISGGRGETVLRYAAEARDWNEALPIGNGRLGAMVFGGARRETLALNEDSMWYGGPMDRVNRDARETVKAVRALLREGRIAEAERRASLGMAGSPESQGHYLPLGNLELEFDHGAKPIPPYLSFMKDSPLIAARDAESRAISGYSRTLDVGDAIARVSYEAGGVSFRRECYASFPDGVIAMRVTASEPGSLSFTARLSRDRLLSYSRREGAARGVGDARILVTGNCGGKGGSDFAFAVSVTARGGTVRATGDTVVVEGADEASIFVAAATAFYERDPARAARKRLDAARRLSFDDVKRRHVADYRALFDRVSFRLDSDAAALTDAAASAVTSTDALPSTDARLEAYRAGADDPGLEELYFNFGRYLLVSSSRPGTNPANLQGIWNRDFHPPWGSKYTININTEMNYWPAEPCALAECHEPLFDLIRRMRRTGRKTARKMYGCRGFVAHHNTDIWGDTAPQDLWIPATFWPMGAAWLCLHLWDHWDYSRDIRFLRRAWPLMRDAAGFFLDYLTTDEKGRLVTSPSSSPENTYLLPNGEFGSLCSGPSMDSQILRELFTRCVEAASVLDVRERRTVARCFIERRFVARVQEALSRFPEIEVGSHGQIMEWSEDYEELEVGHRHVSQLFALYPGSQITPRGTPALAAAARATLERRLAWGGGHTGWSRAWLILLWARLDDGERARENLRALLSNSTLPNLFDNHPPFQIDGNFGGTAAIAEMIARSVGNGIEILPALPNAWPSGEMRGLRARGGLIVDVTWEKGSLVRLTLRATVEAEPRVTYRGSEKKVPLKAGGIACLDGTLSEVASRPR